MQLALVIILFLFYVYHRTVAVIKKKYRAGINGEKLG